MEMLKRRAQGEDVMSVSISDSDHSDGGLVFQNGWLAAAEQKPPRRADYQQVTTPQL